MNPCIFSHVSWTACRGGFWLENHSAEKAIPTFTAALCTKKAQPLRENIHALNIRCSLTQRKDRPEDADLLMQLVEQQLSAELNILLVPTNLLLPCILHPHIVVHKTILRKLYGTNEKILFYKDILKWMRKSNFPAVCLTSLNMFLKSETITKDTCTHKERERERLILLWIIVNQPAPGGAECKHSFSVLKQILLCFPDILQLKRLGA